MVNLFFVFSKIVDANPFESINYEDGSGTLTTEFQYFQDVESNHSDSHFARNSCLRSSSTGSTTPLGPLNNNHYANLQIDDHITSNTKKSDDKKVFKVPFTSVSNRTKMNGPASMKNGAGPLTKPPPSFLQPKSKYTSSAGMDRMNHQQGYRNSPIDQFYNQGKNQHEIIKRNALLSRF